MKKVLSFVLILALVLSSFSMAFAGSSTELKELSDVAGNANEEAIEVAYDLGIVTGNPDGTFQPAKAVTRAEFAAMITRGLAIPQSALAGYANTSFKDTNGYSWAVPYLAFCNSKGIMLGDGAGNAMPGKTITVNEAVTMALRAIGYTANSAELVGVWPSNYVTKAQELKLYDDVAKDAAGVDKANAAQVIYNLLGVQKVAVNSDGETKKLWDVEPNSKGENGKETTLLTSGLNCDASEMRVVNVADIDNSLINMAKHIGKYGTVYRNDDKEVVAFIEESDNTLNGRFKKDGKSLKFVTTADEVEYTVDATTAHALLVNGNGDNTEFNFRESGDVAKDILKATDAISSVNSTEFAISVDLTGKTIKEVYGINTWIADQADQVEKSDIDEITNDKSLLNEDFPLTDDDQIDYTKFQLVGAKSLKDIAADNIVYVYKQSSDDEIIRIEVGTQTAEGVVKNYKSAKEDIATKFAIGANTYKNASEVLNGAAVDGGSTIEEGDVSDELKLYLDARGFVYDFDNLTKANNYAVIKKMGSLDQVQMIIADGTVKTFDYDDDSDKAGKLTAPAIIGYGLNSSGTITDANKNWVSADAITLSSVSVISKIGDTVEIPDGSTYGLDNDGKAVAGLTKEALQKSSVRIASDCVVFTYDKNKEKYTGDLDVTTIDKVEIDEKISNVFLLFDEENNGSAKDKVVAILVPDDMAKSGDKSYAVLNERNASANDDGDKVYHAIGYMDGKKLDTLTDDRSTFDSWKAPAYATSELKNVAVYEVTVDAKGVITKTKTVTTGKAADKDLYRTQAFKLKDADDRNSVVSDDVTVAGNVQTGQADANQFMPIESNTRYAIAKNAVIYKVDADDNEYSVYSGKLKAGDFVQLFETDDDADGFDVVVFYRK